MQAAYITQDLAVLLGLTPRAVQIRAKREGWQSRPRVGRGGGNEWIVASMPQSTRAAIVAGLAKATAPSQPPAIIDAPAPVPSASVGNATQKQLDTAQARLVFVREIARLTEVAGKETAIRTIEQASKDGSLAPHLQQFVAVANDKFGKGRGNRGLSRRRLYDWCSAFESKGISGLVPKKSGQSMVIPEWFPIFLAYYQKPQKPSIALAHKDFCRDYHGEAPSYFAVKRMLAKMAMPDAEAGRVSGNAMLKLRPYKIRKTGMLLPGDVYTADGTTFDAEIQHPDHGQAFKPEITGIIDIATRKCVGLSLALAESAFAVLDALRMACLYGGIPALFYTDNGPGYRNDVLESPAVGMFKRLGIEATYAIPGRPQGKGLMERAVKTLCESAAKRLPTCTHADMDQDAAKKVYKITRADLKKYGKSKLLPTFDDFKRLILARVEEYNATPHRALPKIVDAVTGKRRHMSPNEAWDHFVELGWEPVAVPAEMRDELFMPSEKRKVRNGMVEFYKGKYFAADLEPYHGDFVEVRYDLWDASYVLIYTLDGSRICKAVLDGNAIPYFPQARIDAARATREAARIKRLQDKVQRIAPGAQVVLPEADETFTVSDMFSAPEIQVPEAVCVTAASPVREMAVPNTAPRRPIFESQQQKYLWLMQHNAEQTASDREWLHNYAYGEEYAAFAEFYAFRGIAYPGVPASAE